MGALSSLYKEVKDVKSKEYQLAKAFSNAMFKKYELNNSHIDKQSLLDFVFVDAKRFGLHNGLDLSEYIIYEEDEFSLKSEKFGIHPNSELSVYLIEDEWIYFCIGKKHEKAIFEGLFYIVYTENGFPKLKGNGSPFKTETKMKFFQHVDEFGNVLKDNLSCCRRINFAVPWVGDEMLNREIISITVNNKKVKNVTFIKDDLPRHLGGRQYSIEYIVKDDDNSSYIETIGIIYKDNGVLKKTTIKIMVRGSDHVLFVNNLFPFICKTKLKLVETSENYFILFVTLNNGVKHYFKFPEQKEFIFEDDIKQAVLTDILSFDWVVDQPIIR